jgi:hypothetical protein
LFLRKVKSAIWWSGQIIKLKIIKPLLAKGLRVRTTKTIYTHWKNIFLVLYLFLSKIKN